MRTGFFHVISGAIGGFRCMAGWHKWCKHAATESTIIKTSEQEHVHYSCTKCGTLMEHCPDTGRFLPVDDVKVCLRCGEVRR